jgi:hypothetical protein
MDGGQKLRASLAERGRRLADLRPALKIIGEEIVKRTVESFRNRASPAGSQWDALADSTLRQRVAKLPGASKRSKGTTRAQRAAARGLGVIEGLLGPYARLTKGARKKRATALLAQAMGETSAITPLIDTGRLRSSAQRYKILDASTLSWSVVRYGGAHMSGNTKRPGRPPKRNFSVFEPSSGTGRWTMEPSMRGYAVARLASYVRTGKP